MLKVRIGGRPEALNLDLINYIEDSHKSYFSLKSSSNKELQFTIAFPLRADKSFDIGNFTCVPLMSASHGSESSIFQVYERKVAENDTRIGWVFPLQSLLSKEHSQSDNVYFLRYAFVAFYKLIRGEVFQEPIVFDVNELAGEIFLGNIYPENLIVLTISHHALDEARPNVTDYLPGLFLNDYSYSPDVSFWVDEINSKPIHLPITKITIKKCSHALKGEKYIERLFYNHLYKNRHPLVTFIFLYQIVELLIERVYDQELKTVIVEAGSKSIVPYDLKKKVSGISEELKRITLVFERYLSKPYSGLELVTLVEQYLSSHDSKMEASDHISTAIYKLRNKIFHDFRSLSVEDNFDTLNEINIGFSKLICHIIIYFRSGEEDCNDYLNTAPLNWLNYQLQNEEPNFAKQRH